MRSEHTANEALAQGAYTLRTRGDRQPQEWEKPAKHARRRDTRAQSSIRAMVRFFSGR